MPRRCRKCSGCARARRGKVIARINHGLTGREDSAMLTLTSRPGTDWKKFMAEWSHLLRFLRKTSPHLEYAACKETGSDSGMKHLHVVLVGFRYTPQAAISKEWCRLTGARVVDIRRLKGSHAAAYVAKYVSKQLDGTRKSVTFSRGWPKLPPPESRPTPLDTCPSYGPQVVHEFTSRGAIVVVIVPGCQCWGETRAAEYKDHLWLRWLQDHSSVQSPGP